MGESLRDTLVDMSCWPVFGAKIEIERFCIISEILVLLRANSSFVGANKIFGG